MSSWNFGGSSSLHQIKDLLVIWDIIDDFSFDDDFEDMPYDQEDV